MAKKTLNFTPVTEQIAVVASQQLVTSETVFQGDNITVQPGYTMTFDRPIDMVFLTASGTRRGITEYKNTGTSPMKVMMQTTGASGEARYKMLPNKTSYNVDGAYSVGNKTYNIDTRFELYLKKGDVVIPTSEASGYMVLISGSNVYSVKYGARFTVPAEGAYKVGCERTYYQSQSFRIDPAWQTIKADTAKSGYVYSGGETIELEAGDKLTISASATIVSVYGELLKKGVTSFTATAKDSVYVCSTSKNANLTVTKAAAKPKYGVTYEGAGGMLALKRAAYGKLLTYVDCGLGYMLQEESTGQEYLRYLNMQGIDSIKLVSDSEVTGCIVNEG